MSADADNDVDLDENVDEWDEAAKYARKVRRHLNKETVLDELHAKICISCGRHIAKDAAYCPFCQAKQTAKLPRRLGL